MEPAFQFCDELGPEKILHLYDPQDTGLKAILVVDNVATGPSIGGTRMAPDVSLEECFRLARAMTLKNAAAGLPHGGGKSVIFADPRLPLPEKENLVRAFARAIEDVHDYIPGPDMGTDETCMAWMRDSIGRAVGLPREIGGIPLDEIGATGWGLVAALEVATDFCDLQLSGARVVVQGFGSVGMHAARFLEERGAILVAASDSSGSIVNPDGLDVADLIRCKQGGDPVTEYAKGTRGDGDALIDAECDIWIPAARPDVINADNAGRLRTKVIAQGANIPCTEEAERVLHDRGILVLPDFIANAGGVICASVEYHGGTESQALNTISEKIGSNTRTVLSAMREQGQLPRTAAMAMARERVTTAMQYRRYY
ncbi:MAG: Glu/Leu/Phe/Val dehydrogenase [Halioglobus sp.]|nr:Glu/Leu/Phe/Val dehydrogenase [Halioglobus sp.]